MNKSNLLYILFLAFIVCAGCKEFTSAKEPKSKSESSFVNTKHLDYLNVPITFSDGVKASGIYIYAEAPDYHFVTDSDEGFTCVDDVARATQVYLRSEHFLTDTATQQKAIRLIRFILHMQSANGYFYNFLFPDHSINKMGSTSINGPEWWSWRALQTLTEASPLIKNIDAALSSKIEIAVKALVEQIKKDLIKKQSVTKVVSGLVVPQWLPSGSATDQAAILIIGLIPYCQATTDTTISKYVRQLADGVVMMQQGDSASFPYSCFLSWENVWHAYGSDQSYALLKASRFFKDSTYARKAIMEVTNFYPWLLKNGFTSSFSISKNGNEFKLIEEKKYAQIAYGLRPMVFAAAEAYHVTGDEKFAEIAGNLAAWYMGKNETGKRMYDPATGRCYDGIISKDSINYNSGAESTIEALLALQMVERYPGIKAAFNKYLK